MRHDIEIFDKHVSDLNICWPAENKILWFNNMHSGGTGSEDVIDKWRSHRWQMGLLQSKKKKSYKGTCKLTHSSSYKVTAGRFATDVIHTWNSRLQEGEAEKIFFFCFPKESAMRTTCSFTLNYIHARRLTHALEMKMWAGWLAD